MLVISNCETDKNPINYDGEVIDRGHLLLGNKGTNIVAVTTGNTGLITIIEEGDIENPTQPTIYSSTKQKNFKKSCEEGFDSQPVNYSVTAYSTISQTDADEKALLKLNSEGPQYAIAKGVCECALVLREPSLEYSNNQVRLVIVIPGAKEYKLGLGDWVTTNEFIITVNGDYVLYARNGNSCVVQQIVHIRINTENDIYNIRLGEFYCDINSIGEGIITNIRLGDTLCDISDVADLGNIRLSDSGCSINDLGDIVNIRLVKTC